MEVLRATCSCSVDSGNLDPRIRQERAHAPGILPGEPEAVPQSLDSARGVGISLTTHA